MKNYEIALLVDISVSEDVSSLLGEYQNILSENFCIVHSVDNWGARKLAYPIKKNLIANYLFLKVCISSYMHSILFSKFRQDKRILRFLFIRENGVAEEEKLKV